MIRDTMEKTQSGARLGRVLMAVVHLSMISSPMIVTAADQRNGNVLSEGRGQSLDRLQKADEAANSHVAQARLAQQSLGGQQTAQTNLSAGERAAVELQAQIRSVRMVRAQGAAAVTLTQKTYPDGSVQKTQATYDRTTDQLLSMKTELKDAQGTLLANSSSVFAEQKDGSVQVKTTLTQGTTITNTVVVRKADGTVVITGQTREGSAFYPRITDFTTTIDANGNLRRVFTTKDTGTNSTTRGIQVNNVTTATTTSSTGNSTTTVTTILADGTVKAETVYRRYGGNGGYTEIRQTSLTKRSGISASLSPYEPALFVGKVLSIKSGTVGMLKYQIQLVLAAVSRALSGVFGGD